MFEESVVEKRLDWRAVLRIRNKRRGAQNNENGGRFELQILILFLMHHAVKSLKDRKFLRSLIIQNAQCFVDDVVVQTPYYTYMVQVKHVSALTWAYPGLKQDFQRQSLISDLLPNKLVLYLAVHRQDVAKTFVETASQFGMEQVKLVVQERNRYAPSSVELAKDLCFGMLSAAGPESVIRHLESAWVDLGGAATVEQVLARASANSSGTVRNMALSDPAAEAVTEALDSIMGLRAEADGSNMFLEIETPEGTFESVETNVDFQDLLRRIEIAREEKRFHSLQHVWQLLTGPKKCF